MITVVRVVLPFTPLLEPVLILMLLANLIMGFFALISQIPVELGVLPRVNTFDVRLNMLVLEPNMDIVVLIGEAIMLVLMTLITRIATAPLRIDVAMDSIAVARATVVVRSDQNRKAALGRRSRP